MESIGRRVLKLGGSVLTLDDWQDRLRRWIAAQSPADDAIVVGGGRLADSVRALDRQKRIDDAEAHWMCVAAMAINAARVAESLKIGISLAADIRAGLPQQRLSVIDPWHFLRKEDGSLDGEPLPTGWNVTSDSIAARVAQFLDAKTLVLFKSCLPSHDDAHTMAETGYVDSFFPHASAKIERIVCVDLRSTPEL